MNHTPSDVTTSTIPIGINIKPMIKKTGSAVLAVMIGCHAGRRCCLKAVSRITSNTSRYAGREIQRTCRFLALLLFSIFFIFCRCCHPSSLELLEKILMRREIEILN